MLLRGKLSLRENSALSAMVAATITIRSHILDRQKFMYTSPPFPKAMRPSVVAQNYKAAFSTGAEREKQKEENKTIVSSVAAIPPSKQTLSARSLEPAHPL